MSLRLIAGIGVVWPQITFAAKAAARADVAVAYFAKGGAKRLPLRGGSRLVVDAAEANVKAGSTCPAELLTLLHKGVEVYHYPNLHAKVFVFPRSAFIGSANASALSSDTLCEAMVQVTDPIALRQMRAFVIGLLSNRLGPKELEKLQTLYREPRVSAEHRKPRRAGNRLPRVWFDYFDEKDVPSGSEEAVEEARAKARAKLTEAHVLEEVIYARGKPQYQPGDTVIRVDEDLGGRKMVVPPARVLHLMQWGNGRARYSFTYTERPRGNRVTLDRLTKSLGRGWRKRLARGRRLPRAEANEMLAWWHR